MIRYLQNVPGQPIEGVRLVHNFYPGPEQDWGRGPEPGNNGWRIWITDQPGNERRCYCGWPDGREHYGTVHVIEAPAT